MDTKPSYTEAWAEVKQLESKQKINDACKKAKEILQQARADKNYPQIIKTFIHSLDYQNEVVDDGFFPELKELEAELDNFPPADKAFLHSILGEIYLNYLSVEYFSINKRTDVDVKDGDVATYSTKQLLRTAKEHFLKSIEDIEPLKNRKTIDYKDILLGSYDDKHNLMPTLYDFLAHRALTEFFEKDISRYEVFDDNFDLSNNDLLKPKDYFLKLEFDGKLYENSAAYQAFLIYQNLIRLHDGDSDKKSLLYNDFTRLRNYYSRSVSEDKQEQYIATLRAMETTYADSDALRDQVRWEIAKYYDGKGDVMKAKYVAQQIIDSNADNNSVSNAKILIYNVLLPNLSANVDKYIPTEHEIVFKTTHKNIDKVYFRIGKVSRSFFDKPGYLGSNYLDGLAQVMTDCKNYSFDVEKNPEHAFTTSELSLPPQPFGYYAIMISNREDFSLGSTYFHLIQITDLVAVDAPMPNSNTIKVLDRTTGQPVENAIVTVTGEEYRDHRSVTVTYAEKNTDKDGNAQFQQSEIQARINSLDFTVKKGDDFLDKNSFSFTYESGVSSSTTLKIFTDRALYRPGQTVYFKGIYFSKEGNNINVLPNRKVFLSVLDINRQKVYDDILTTNEFGSISGSFQLGTSVVLGCYNFWLTSTYNVSIVHTFSVEEYKRPTFEVFTDEVKDEIALNQNVTITGNAKTYSGVNVENAEVKYEIIRAPRFRGWWCFNYKMKEKSVANGIVKTDADGKFAITFNAKPDKTLPEDLGLTFTYKVKIEVTSQDGETQVKNTSLSVGYASIFMQAPLYGDLLFKGRDAFKEVPIAATNASGQPVDCDVTVIIKHLKNFAKPDRNNKLDALEDDKVLKTFVAKSNTRIDLSLIDDYEDGNYCVRYETKDAQGHDINAESRFTLVSEVCEKADFNKYFWFDIAKRTCYPGETAKFIFGTSQKDVLLWYEIFQGDRPLTDERRITLSQNSQIVEFPITAENRGGISIRYFFVKDNQSYSNTTGVHVPYENKHLDIKYESFRDKLQPGEQETIRLKILDHNGQPVNAELLATLYDESLDAIRSNVWQLYYLYDSNPYCNGYHTYRFDTAHRGLLSIENPSSYYTYSFRLILNWFSHRIQHFGRQNILMRNMMFGGSAFGGMMMASASAPMGMAMASPMTGMMGMMMMNAKQADNSMMAQAIAAPMAQDNVPTPPQADSTNFDNVKVRENFSETAFFEPHLVTDSEGNVLIEFTIPESLTKWHFKAVAHTKDMQHSISENHLITQKSFMVEPNLPRFFMEGDQITIPVKISNLTDQPLSGKAKIDILDAQTQAPVEDYGIDLTTKEFSVDANHTGITEFAIAIPKRPEPVIVKIVGISDGYSDGSQKYVPVLTTRTLITESQSFNIRAHQTKQFTVEGLKQQSQTQDNQSFTFEFTSNPAWMAFMALPSLRETTSDNLHSVMSAYYANSVARKIITSNPGLEATYNALSEEDLKSPLEKNQELKNILLNETPWLLYAKNESEGMKKLAHLFNKKAVDEVNSVYIKKLKEGQYYDGGWPWHKGMKQNQFITQDILIDLGRLRKLDAIENENDRKAIEQMTKLAIGYIDKQLEEDYKDLKERLKPEELETYFPGYYAIQYFYARSYFTELPLPQSTQEAYNFYLEKIEKHWTNFTMYGSAMIAITFKRLGRPEIPAKIIEMFQNNAQYSEEFGMYYSKNLNGYHWYNSPIETQAAIIEAFAEFNKPHEVEELKIWLIKNKQTNSWSSVRATVEAVYALLMNGERLNTKEQPCKITIGGKRLDGQYSEGAAYIKKTYPKAEISQSLADITIENPNSHIAYGASYIQYFEEYENVRSTANGLTLKKELYLIKKNDLGEDVATLVTPGTPLHPGDKIKARFVMTTDRDLEFVFLKDNHSATFEPSNKLSGMRHQDSLWYYESTKDAAEEFFIDFMQRGTYVFEYQLFAVHKGILSNGIATVECMYAPEFRANSTSQKVKVE